MAVNIASVRQQITLVKAATTSPEAFAKEHARIARAALADLEAKQGQYPTVTVVDGRRDASEDSVRPFGVIQYEIHVMQDAVDWVYAEWVKRSPFGPDKDGHYRDDILMFVDGYRRDAKDGTVDLSGASEVALVNIRPYARKIANGLSAQAPAGWVEVLAREANRRFADFGIVYEFRSIGGYGRRQGEAKTSRQKAADRWPAIVIKVL